MQTSLSSSPTLSFGSVGALRTYSTLVLSKSFSDIWRNISALGSVSIVSVFKWITFFDCSSNTFHWVRTVLHYYLFKLLMSQNYLHSLHLHMFTAISLRCGSKEGNGEEGKIGFGWNSIWATPQSPSPLRPNPFWAALSPQSSLSRYAGYRNRTERFA